MPALAELPLRQRHAAAVGLLRRREEARGLSIEERLDLLCLVVWPELFSEETGAGKRMAA